LGSQNNKSTILLRFVEDETTLHETTPRFSSINSVLSKMFLMLVVTLLSHLPVSQIFRSNRRSRAGYTKNTVRVLPPPNPNNLRSLCYLLNSLTHSHRTIRGHNYPKSFFPNTYTTYTPPTHVNSFYFWTFTGQPGHARTAFELGPGLDGWVGALSGTTMHLCWKYISIETN